MNLAKHKYVIAVGLISLAIWSNSALAQLTEEQLSAKQRGIVLYNQSKDGESELRIAAEAGDTEAQYYLGDQLRHDSSFMTPEAQKWFTSAANQGELYAMLRLSGDSDDLCKQMNNCPAGEKLPSEWRAELITEGKKRAAQGDSEAMFVLYLATADLAWLEKSANAGYAVGQRLLASRYEEHQGTFFPPWKRSSAIKQLLKDSAEGGYPKGMVEYGAILYEEKDFEGYRHWNEMAAKTGYADAVLGLGIGYSGVPESHTFPEDLVKGYGYIYLLTELNGGGGMQESISYVLPRIIKKMTPDQITAGKKFAADWKASHPPLSFFPPKLQY
jgi:TPR repeat protein